MPEKISEQELYKRIKAVKLLVLDVDGVMTDGGVIYNDLGHETKVFDVKDGHGIKLLMRGGVEVAIITSRQSQVVGHRAANLGIKYVYQGALEKIKAYDELISKLGITPDESACMGDDLVDMPMLKKAAFAVTVPDGVAEVIEIAHYVTKNKGGHGAVRETAELILKAQGKWQDVIRRYL
ncbi:HAD-IIIA family hydrolase [bacterium]|nr:MAG: HAD-IIIA family hydrolase [bacterium]